MNLKLILLIVALICSILIGFKIKQFYIIRQKFYNEFCKFCDYLMTNISYNSQKISLIISDYKNSCHDNCFINFLLILEDYLLNKIELDILKSKFEKEFMFLNKDEKFFIINFVSKLGNFSKDEELKNIENQKSFFESEKKIISENNRKYSNLYFKLFIILGLILVIIFI